MVDEYNNSSIHDMMTPIGNNSNGNDNSNGVPPHLCTHSSNHRLIKMEIKVVKIKFDDVYLNERYHNQNQI